MELAAIHVDQLDDVHAAGVRVGHLATLDEAAYPLRSEAHLEQPHAAPRQALLPRRERRERGSRLFVAKLTGLDEHRDTSGS